MRIGIDSSLVAGDRAGIGQYCLQWVRALSRIDYYNQYLLYPAFCHTFHPQYRQASLPRLLMQVAFATIPAAVLPMLRHPYSPWLVREWLLGQVDVVHSTNFSAPRFRNRHKRLVMTIYDLSFLVHPEFHVPENVKHAMQGTREAVARADALLTISQHSRGELMERMGVTDDRVVITRLAADPRCTRMEDTEQIFLVRKRYGLPEHFILFVGSLEPRKMYSDSYKRMRNSLPRSETTYI